MKIAIHPNKGSFSDRWIEYCEAKGVAYKLVNAYDSNIVEQLVDCDAFMWHFLHYDYRDLLFAKQLLTSLELAGKRVFPDMRTAWHFDDKVGQKYLLEALHIPLVPSSVFYTREQALSWISSATFPKVFKLRGGAGSANVWLAHTRNEAGALVRRAFGRGFSQFDRCGYLKERIRKYKEGKDSFLGVCKGVGRLFFPPEFAKMHAPEKGYVYFQDFIPDNAFDIRVIVTGDKAFAIKRMVREHDFRASGSGFIFYKKEDIDIRCVELAFRVNKQIHSQSLACDFVFDNGSPLLVEISYGYSMHVYDPCPGYWTEDLTWVPGEFKPQYWQVENLLKE